MTAELFYEILLLLVNTSAHRTIRREELTVSIARDMYLCEYEDIDVPQTWSNLTKVIGPDKVNLISPLLDNPSYLDIIKRELENNDEFN